MNRIVVCLVVLIVCAQQGWASADSLRTIWENQAETDSVRMDAGVKWAKKIVLEDADSAAKICRQILHLSNGRYPKLRAQAMDGIALKHSFHYQSDSAMHYANLALEESRACGDTAGIIKLNVTLANELSTLSRDSAAIEVLQEAARLASELDDADLMSMVATTLVKSYYAVGDSEASFREALRGYKFAQQSGNTKYTAMSAIQLAQQYKIRGELLQSIELNLEAVDILEKRNDLYNAAMGYHNLGHIYEGIQQYENALECYSKIIDIAQKFESEYIRAIGSYRIASIFLEINDLDQALSYALEACEIYERNGADGDLAPTYGTLGYVYLRRGNIDQAIRQFDKGLAIKEKTGENIQMTDLLCGLGAAYYEKGDCQSSLQYAQQAYSLAQNFGLDNYIYKASFYLQKCYAEAGNYKKAHDYAIRMSEARDSLTAKEQRQAVLRKVYEYEYEQKAAADSLAASEEKLRMELAHQEEIDANARTRNILFGAGALLLLIAGGGWSRANLIRKSNKRLKEARDRAEESERFKQRFLANMSHEIRTPMNAVLGMSQLTLDTELSVKQRGYLEAIKNSSENLLVIVNDILDLSKLEQGKLTLEEVPFSLRERFNIVRETLEFKAEEKGLSFRIEIDDQVPEVVMGDPGRLTQVMLNLVSNAIKFTEKGGVHIKAEQQPNHRIRFSVRDTGIGIPSEKQAQLFQSFQQVDNSTSRKYDGTGLGLAISKDLVELQGGSISVQSAVDAGSVFAFDLELPPAKSQSRPSHSEDVSPDLSGIKVLVAEDNVYNQMVIVDTLENLIDRVETTLVENGQQALDLMDEQDFDVVLMDAHMPVMDGIEATRYIRSQDNNTPIIALTASVLDEEINSCLEAGMNDSLPKPFQREDLLRILGGYYASE